MRKRNNSVYRTTVFSLVIVASVMFGTANSPSRSADALTEPVADLPPGGFEPTFGMEGELMYQLLMAFGSENVARGLEMLKLNCEPRLLAEEIRGDTAFVNVSLECECLDPEGGYSAITRLRGEWELRLTIADQDAP